ncbi:ATPase [Psychrobacillus sp. NEAU-3TGS]|uniref:ATPase n=1 Tax=Psychrobacillus sp. NEAU-3TGS TaxID=2995412 RepID=UPI0024979893|nr:ATPase [Psychrobacillus sp. NEAU-3TGS]MDI2587956.1 ATPase [Psychrobacillus sp. NEAU-3TGS]
MPLTTGPIENQGNQPANATNARVKILNRTGGPLTGVVRVFRLNGTRQQVASANFSAAANASTFVTLSVGGAAQYEVEIVPNQTGGLYSVYGRTASGVIITAQRVLHSELVQIL